MTTLNEMIELIKLENPDGLRIGDDERGYTALTAAEYDATILKWATARLEKQKRSVEAEAVIEAKKQAIIKLAELGIDSKAFGLQTEQLTPQIAPGE